MVTRDKAKLDELVQRHTPLIWSIVRRFMGRGVEAEDLFQLGAIGLIKAIDGYDDSFGTQFSTYAVPKIMGEIKRFLRDDGMVKISRSIKEKAYAIEQASRQLRAETVRSPKYHRSPKPRALNLRTLPCACRRLFRSHHLMNP